MKKLAVLSLLACLVLPASAQAADYGVYIAPKFAVGIQHSKYRETNNISGYYNNNYRFDFSWNKAAVGGALAIGYDFSTRFGVPVRTELEYSMFGNSTKTHNHQWDRGVTDYGNERVEAKTRIQSLFVNVYYDFQNSSNFTPYIGAGLGLGFVNTKASYNGHEVYGAMDTSWHTTFGSKTRTNFAWNIGLGVAYAFNDNFSVDLGYRYAQFGKGRTNSRALTIPNGYEHGESRRNNMHQFMLSARVTF